MATNETTHKFKVDISELKSAMQTAKRQVAIANSEFRETASTMEDWSKSSDGLSAKLKQLDSNLKSQKSILANLEKQYELTVKEMGEGSKAAEDLKIKINNQKSVINNTEREISNFKSRLDEVTEAEKKAAKTGKSVSDVLNEMEQEAKEAGDGFTVFKGAVATFAGNVMTGLANGIKGAIGSLAGLSDETREYRTELAKINTVAKDAGLSTDYIKDKWHDMGAVLGDEGAVAEGLNNLVTAGFTTQEQMDAITGHLEGAAVKWKDTLKFEGLADGLQETLATGKAVGPFAEMLERFGVNLETFDKGLGKCKTSAEQQNYVLQELSKLGLNEVSEAYRTQNADLIEANKANTTFSDNMATLGGKLEPVTTAVKEGFNGVLTKILELVEGVDFEAFTAKVDKAFKVLTDDVLPVVKDGLGWILDNKDTIIAGLAGIATGFTAFKVAGVIASVTKALKGMSVAQMLVAAKQWLLNTALLANPIGLVVAAIAGLVAAFVVLWKKSDSFRNFWIKTWEKIKSVVGVFLDYFKNLPAKIGQQLTTALNKVATWAVNLANKGKEAGKKLLDSVVEAVKELPSKMLSIGADLVSGIWTGINDKVQWLKDQISGFVGDVTGWLKTFFKIGSPSKLMAEEVGRWLPEGIAVGIDKNAKSVLNSMRSLANGTVSVARSNLGGSTVSGSGVGGMVNNFTQIINSPAQLSRLDIYRQTKNLLGYVGGVS